MKQVNTKKELLYPAHILTLILIIALNISSCNNKNEEIEEVLKASHNNRLELEKVLSSFKDNPFKYEAACFLISNMYDKHTYSAETIDSIKQIKSIRRPCEQEIEKWKNYNYQKNGQLIRDIDVIKSDLLIDNINLACDVWLSRPWHKYYSFKDFCEYVLPYRIADEELSNWRQSYFNRYNSIVDSVLKYTTDIIEVSAAVSEHLKNEGFDNYDDGIRLPNLGAIYLLNNRLGFCRENCDIASYAMRSLGIPIATDQYITSPSYNSKHMWSAIIDTTGRAIPFNYTEGKPSRNNNQFNRKIGKVYRLYFGKQPLKFKISNDIETPNLFTNHYLSDVSNQYFNESSRIKLSLKTNQKWVYLSVYDGFKYRPIDIAEMKNGIALFHYIEDNIILFPVTYQLGAIKEAGFPILTKNGLYHEFIPEKKKLNKVVLRRKYPLRNTMKFLSNIIGGKITYKPKSNSNTQCLIKIFSDTIKKNSIEIKCNLNNIRHITYHGPKDKNIELAEFHIFYKGKEITPVTISSDKKLDDIHYRNLGLITDNVWHSFYLSQPNEILSFDLGRRQNVDSILLVPRNDDNFVRKGQDYELFYHDGIRGWISLGRQISKADSLIYDNIPSNSILWLHNHSGGKEERVFYIQDGKQIFI